MINRVVLVGRLTRDPELRHTAGGTAVAELGIAVNSREKGADGEWGDRADFFDVTVWEAQAEACAQYLSKGKQVGIDGRLRLDRWEDRDTGEKRSKVRIIATTVQFLEPSGDAEVAGDYNREPVGGGGPPDDDFPF